MKSFGKMQVKNPQKIKNPRRIQGFVGSEQFQVVLRTI